MRIASLVFFLLLLFCACKKENAEAEHTVQFASNITNQTGYMLSINGTVNNDISQTYKLKDNSDISLQLYRSSGDTTSLNSGDSLWVRAGIIVDGILVKSYAGYNDATLLYHIE